MSLVTEHVLFTYIFVVRERNVTQFRILYAHELDASPPVYAATMILAYLCIHKHHANSSVNTMITPFATRDLRSQTVCNPIGLCNDCATCNSGHRICCVLMFSSMDVFFTESTSNHGAVHDVPFPRCLVNELWISRQKHHAFMNSPII